MGGLIACSILAGRAVAPLAQISQLLSRMTSTRTAYRQLNEMMDMPPEGPEGEALKLGRVEGRIEFRNVGFRYPGAPEQALDGAQLHHRAGRACRPARPGRLGQVDHRPADPRPLSARGRAGDDRRHRHPPARSARPAPQYRRGDAGERAADRLGAREYRARPAAGRRRGDDPRRRAFGHPPVHGPDRQRLRPQARRPRRGPVGRPAPVDRDRPRARRPAAGAGLRRAVQRDGRADRRRR